jgi:uncharacterized protein (DUF305 family)
MRNRLLAPSLLAVALAVAGCGSNAASKTAPTDAMTNATTAAKGTFNGADVEFAQQMIPHHEQAVEMAQLALDAKAGANAKVRDLATRIKGAQDPEIKLMTGWLAAWGEPKTAAAGHNMSEADGMMSADVMAALAKATGTGFDRMWLTMMIEHHQGAIKMAQDEKTQGSNPDALALAGEIVAAQQAEIAEMSKLIAG